MFEHSTRIASENLARGMNRRTFLRRLGEATFAGVAALAAGHVLGPGASASSGRLPPGPDTPACSPPGPYCNLNGVNEPNGCHGGSCFQHLYQGQVLQCRIYYTYQVGCWTTPVTGGYWTCCDCECGTPRVTTCGCAQFSGGPAPRPDGISKG